MSALVWVKGIESLGVSTTSVCHHLVHRLYDVRIHPSRLASFNVGDGRIHPSRPASFCVVSSPLRASTRLNTPISNGLWVIHSIHVFSGCVLPERDYTEWASLSDDSFAEPLIHGVATYSIEKLAYLLCLKVVHIMLCRKQAEGLLLTVSIPWIMENILQRVLHNTYLVSNRTGSVKWIQYQVFS